MEQQQGKRKMNIFFKRLPISNTKPKLQRDHFRAQSCFGIRDQSRVDWKHYFWFNNSSRGFTSFIQKSNRCATTMIFIEPEKVEN